MEAGVDTFRLEVPVNVRFRDLDIFGHVNNAVYFTYCEIARNAYWTKLFGSRRSRTTNFIIARAELDYRSQTTDEHSILVGIRISSIGRSSFDFHYNILEEGSRRLIAEGRSVQVIFDYTANQKTAMPDSVKDRILAFEGAENVVIRGEANRG
jgi:acyl-CoA thioester hydrolase